MKRPGLQAEEFGKLAARGRSGRVLVGLLGGVLVMAILAGVVLWLQWSGWQRMDLEPAFGRDGRMLPQAGFKVFADTAHSCKSCHAMEFEDWSGSHHAHANRLVDLDIDRPAFDPAQRVTTGSYTSEFRLEGNEPVILTMGPSGQIERFVPDMVLAYDPLRQFLIPFPGGRWQVTEMAFDPAQGDWFNVYGDEDRRPDEWGFWTNRSMNWNSNCAACHMTGYEKNYHIATDSYTSKWNEMGISCAQCHAGLDGHAEAFANSPEAHGPLPLTLSPELLMESCAGCHSRREEMFGGFGPGDRYHDHYRLALPSQPGLYYADGQIRDEVFVYGSFSMSKMGHAGVSCLDCHNPHTNRIILPVSNNALCMSCHAPPTRMDAQLIDPVAHSFHPAESTGNSCVECHMTHTVYMERDPRRDHGFIIPDPLLTRELGIPNACNKCHTDQTVDWAIEWVDRWYGEKMERPERERTRLIHRAYQGEPGLGVKLAQLAEAQEIPGWRATLIDLAANYPPEPEILRVATAALEHEDPLVRSAAVRLLGSIHGQDGLVDPLAEDPTRLVRMDVAWIRRGNLDPESQLYKDLMAYLEFNADQPLGAARLGQFAFARGRAEDAEDWYRKAISWDVHSIPLHHDLAIMLNARGDAITALETLREAREVSPENPQTHFMLGLLEAEAGTQDAAQKAFENTVALDPRFFRAWYNLALLHAQEERLDKALDAIRKAEESDPGNADAPFVRATLHLRRGESTAAREAALSAVQANPNHRQAIQLLMQLERGSERRGPVPPGN